MNNKYLLIGIGLVVGLVAGYFIFSSVSTPKLGANITAYNCLNNAALCNSLNSLAQDIANQRSINAGLIASSSAVFNAVALGAQTSTTALATTSVTLTGAVAGDYCLVGTTVATVNTTVTCSVASGTAIVSLVNMQAAQNSATTTFFVIDLPKGSFTTPPALITTTSTSF